MPTSNVCITLSPEAKEELAVKCRALGMNKSAFIELAIAMDFDTLAPEELARRRANIVARRAVGLEIKGNPAEEINDYFRGKENVKKKPTKLDVAERMSIINSVTSAPAEKEDLEAYTKKTTDKMDLAIEEAIQRNKQKAEESIEKPSDAEPEEPAEEQAKAEPTAEPEVEPKQERPDFLKPSKKKTKKPSFTV